MNIEDDQMMVAAHFAFEITTIRMFDDMMVPSNMSFRVEVSPNPDAPQTEVNLALKKIRYWLDSLNETIMTSVSNGDSMSILIDTETKTIRVANSLMLLPRDPDEETVAAVIQSKLNALADGTIQFGFIEVEAKEADGIGYTYFGDASVDLPSWDEWLGSVGPNWFNAPWWMRNDGSMFDSIPPEGTDLSVPPSWVDTLEHLSKKPNQRGAVVTSGNFKPKVVDGGKSTDDPK